MTKKVIATVLALTLILAFTMECYAIDIDDPVGGASNTIFMKR